MIQQNLIIISLVFFIFINIADQKHGKEISD